MPGKAKEVRALDVSRLETLVFAGGGNRCWWQAGALRHLLEHGLRLPSCLVGTSAGAGLAAAFLTESAQAALDACLDLFAGNAKVFDWAGLRRLKLKFAHQQIYPAWVEAFLNSGTFSTLKGASSRLTVGLSRPARYLGTGTSVAMGTLAYIVDKYLWNSIHPRLPGLLGLRQDFIVLNDCATVEAAQLVLVAAASAPPIMAARRVGTNWAFDGGYTDNAPIPPQSNEERSKTLVMLTRHYPKLPLLFTWLGRTYWQPSRRIPVSTWDCTPKTTVRQAYELGLQDAVQVLSTGLLR
jgi:predicted acylesterase/phospholipase RssA